VRGRSAAALGKRDGDHLPALLKMLASDDRDVRYGAIEALGALGSRADAAVAPLRACLTESDPWVQSLAAEAIPQLSQDLRKACVSDLLAMTLRTNPADPRRMAQRAASIALFAPFPGKNTPRSILAQSLDGVDRALLYPAIESLLQNEDPIVRGSLAKSYQKLSDEDLVRLLPAIVKAIEKPAPSNEMFADGVRLAGLDLLSRLHIREGMDLIIKVIEPQRWGERNRSHTCLEYLKRYGKHTQAFLPQLAEIRALLVSENKSKQHLAEFDEQVTAISTSQDTPTLVNLHDFK
jgi:HEAT repeat protein